MFFAYSTNAFVKFTLHEAIEKIAQLGFRGVEIMGDRPHLYPPDFQKEALDHLKKLILAKNFKVTNLNSFTLFAVGDTYLPSWIEPSEERRRIRIEHTLQCLQMASALGCKNISVPPGGPLGEITRKEARLRFLNGLEKVIPLAEQLQVNILIEPEPNLFLENSREFKEFIGEARSPWVGLNFDIGHFFCAGENPAHAFQDLFRWIGHIHLEDIGLNRIHHHLIPGLGAINFREVFTEISRLKYEGDISLELYTYSETPVKAGQEALEYLLPIFEDAGLKID
jgi:sugar phosphate isomerase/epimerase